MSDVPLVTCDRFQRIASYVSSVRSSVVLCLSRITNCDAEKILDISRTPCLRQLAMPTQNFHQMVYTLTNEVIPMSSA